MTENENLEAAEQSDGSNGLIKGCRYGLGHRPQPEGGLKAKLARARFGAPGDLSSEVTDLEPLLRAIKDQSITSSCVAQAITQGADLRFRKLGRKDTPPFSALASYAYGRYPERVGPDAPLIDVGSYPLNVVQSAASRGFAPEADWPFDESKVNEPPPWDVDQKASVYRVQDCWEIATYEEARIDDACHVLASGSPFVMGNVVGKAIEDYNGQGAIGPAEDKNYGAHMMLVLGYITTAGQRWFRIANSWGTAWGDHGFMWATEDYLADPRASDFFVIEVEENHQ